MPDIIPVPVRRWSAILGLVALVLTMGATWGRPLALYALGAASQADIDAVRAEHGADIEAINAKLDRIERATRCTYLTVRFEATRADCEALEVVP